MSALLFSTAMIIFLIGLVSEQITSLIYNQHYLIKPTANNTPVATQHTVIIAPLSEHMS